MILAGPIPAPFDTPHGQFNLVEAMLWGVIAVALLMAGRAQSGARRRRCRIGAGAFAIFAVTDIVEIFTGHWARPLGLLVVKVACVIVMGWLLWADTVERRSSDGTSAEGEDRERQPTEHEAGPTDRGDGAH